MLKSHEKFYSENGRRLVLVAADDPETREHFEGILKQDYVLMFATNMQEAKELILENGDVLSLVVLRLTKPVSVSLEVLAMIQKEPELQHIPVTIVDAKPEMEIIALSQGAIDFIPIPYPAAGIILARIQRTIELSEDRAIISSTERDPLTGLYNREFFYRYAEQYDHHHKGQEMDAIVIDVNNFRTINERFGSVYGDEILRRIGERVRDMVKDSGGIVCRREADTFQVYCPHGKNYQAILDNASIGLAGDESLSDRVRLRMGVYSKVDKNIALDRRFDRANMACASVRSVFTKNIGMYDSSLHERELEDARLVEEFQTALRERQFRVFYQPKFDVRGEKPILTSAEALVRWIHPKKGTIAPNRFVPLFETNGLIQPLDHFIWEEVARQIRDWKNRVGFTVPISVNVSRINMYDPNMVNFLMSLVKKYRLHPSDLYLEITESAYTEDSDRIVQKVELLRDLGFRIEMDDFGTGYSSLNMISKLPIDVMKLDMEFIQAAFQGRKSTRMLEIMLDIAEYLDVPVVAEGVETEDQMNTLRQMGCDVIQGFFFARPLPAGEFEAFLLTRRAEGNHVTVFGSARTRPVRDLQEGQGELKLSGLARSLFHGYSRVFDVDPVTEQYVEYRVSEEGDSLRVEKEGTHFFDYPSRNLIHYLHPEDQKVFLEMFSKERVVAMLSTERSLSGVFRLLFNDEPTFVCVRATAEGENDIRRIIIGISTVDVQILQDHRYQEAVRTIGRDSLTGTKNMTAYIQMERKVNEDIKNGEMESFALAVVDMDGYRKIRRRLGQKAANKGVQALSSIVCDVFDHSPVYRIGDDEFIALLKGRDYENREELKQMLLGIREENEATDEVEFSFGIADYLPGEDRRLSTVFERANDEMYARKPKGVDAEV